MENKKGINFFFAIIAIILGVVIYKQFDVENLRFEKPVLATVYIVTFLFSIFFLIRNYTKRTEK
jgi:hypothetical protein